MNEQMFDRQDLPPTGTVLRHGGPAPVRPGRATIAVAAGRVAQVGTGSFVLVVGALHLLRADLDPSWRVLSEYAIGQHGWLMTTAFLLLAGVSAALAVGSWTAGSRVLGRIGSILLVVTAAGMAMAGLFRTDPITSVRHTDVGRLHELGALLDLTPFAAVVVSVALLRAGRAGRAGRADRTSRTLLAVTMFAPLLGLVVFATATVGEMPASGVGSPEVLIGWPNRLLVLGYCAWMAATGRYLTRATSSR